MKTNRKSEICDAKARFPRPPFKRLSLSLLSLAWVFSAQAQTDAGTWGFAAHETQLMPDFRLYPSSPAIGTARPGLADFDFKGKPRPAQPSLGALEP